MKDDIEQQQKTLIQILYQYMSRGILRSSRLEFALHVVHKMYPKQISNEEWKLFLGSATHLNRDDTGGIPLWIPDQNKTNAKMFQVTFITHDTHRRKFKNIPVNAPGFIRLLEVRRSQLVGEFYGTQQL